MKKKLSLQDFAEILAQREDIDRKAADAFARSFFDIIEQGLQTDKFVKIKGFGTFKLVAKLAVTRRCRSRPTLR